MPPLSRPELSADIFTPDPVATVKREAIIGASVFGNVRPERPSLSGDAALTNLDLDIEHFLEMAARPTFRLADEDAPIFNLEAAKDASERYRRVITALLTLNDQAFLSNCGDGEYSPELRDEEPAEGGYVSHIVWLPYRAGGFLQFRGRLTTEDGFLIVDGQAFVDYAEGDVAGREADASYNEERNGNAAEALLRYANGIFAQTPVGV